MAKTTQSPDVLLRERDERVQSFFRDEIKWRRSLDEKLTRPSIQRDSPFHNPHGVTPNPDVSDFFAIPAGAPKDIAGTLNFYTLLYVNGLFTLWKDTDPDIPILIAAKSEYAKLKSGGVFTSKEQATAGPG